MFDLLLRMILAGYAELKRELRTPIQLGENFYGPRSLFHALSAGAGDYVMPDLMRIGGVTGWLLDRWLGISPWAFIVFLLLGFVAGLINLMRSAGVLSERNWKR